MALSKTQNRRLGSILSIMFKEEIPESAIVQILKDGLIERQGDDFILTAKGIDEKNRLCTLAGLNIKYQSERSKPDAEKDKDKEGAIRETSA